MQIAVLAHGKLNGHPKLQQLVTQLELQHHVVVYYSKQPGETELQASACCSTTELLIAAGGDGTLHQVVNGVFKNHTEGGRLPLLAVFPLGSGNDFARTIGSSGLVTDFITKLEARSFSVIDVLRLRLNDADGKPVVRYCLNICDVGIGGEIARWLHKIPAWLGPDLKYLIATLCGFLIYRTTEVDITCSSNDSRHRILSFVMANGRYFGNGLGIAPHAKPDDGNISTVMLGRLSVFHYLYFLPTLKQCRRVMHPEVTYGQEKALVINVSGRALPVDVDGELGGYTPLTVDVMEKAVKLLA